MSLKTHSLALIISLLGLSVFNATDIAHQPLTGGSMIVTPLMLACAVIGALGALTALRALSIDTVKKPERSYSAAERKPHDI